jgi:hypothetical protein
VHLFGFIIRKFVTMHGHMNVKLNDTLRVTYSQSWREPLLGSTSDVPPVLARAPPGVHDHICIKLIKIGKWYRSQKKTADSVGRDGTERGEEDPGGRDDVRRWLGEERENRSISTNYLLRIKYSALQSPDLAENTVYFH